MISWSTIRIKEEDGKNFSKEKMIHKFEIEEYVKKVAKMIVDYVGEAGHTPASTFREIIRAIALNEK